MTDGEGPPILVVEPTRGFGHLGIGELWRYRELLWFMTTREVKGRYRQMALGPLWIVIKPVVDMVLFSVVFGGLAKLDSEGVPYPLFTFAAILPWSYFSTATTGAANSLVTRMNVISKVYFPRLLVPIAEVLAAVVDFCAAFLVLLGLLLYYETGLTVRVFALPLFLALAVLTALAIGLWSATLTVRFRDLKFAITYALQVAMYATPVAYSATHVPERWQTLYQMNPMYWVVEGFRWSLLGLGDGPRPLMAIPVFTVFVLLLFGAYVFRRSERTIVDLL